jgi:hypothetical protein
MITPFTVMAANPFVYGEIVSDAAFADREVERDRLARDLLAGQKVFLISPRRYGKSSLVRAVLRSLARQGVITVEVQVAASSSYVGFLEAYARALLTADVPVGRVRQLASELFGSVRPEVRIAPEATGSSRVTLGFPSVTRDRDVARLAAEVFALPGRISEARKCRLAVALDEFQAITAFDGGTIEHALRAAVQDQRQVGYVFAGSEPSLMEQMLTPRRPFYKAGPVIRLDRIDPDAFAEFIERRFRTTGLRPEAGLGLAVVDLAGNVPYDVQRLAHELWDDSRAAGRRDVTIEMLHGTLTRLLQEHGPMFEDAWQRLTLPQRAVLRAVVLENGRELLGAGVRARHRLSSASSVQASLTALVRGDLIARPDPKRYVVVDSLFREWVARQTY